MNGALQQRTKFLDRKINLDFFIHFFCFLSVLFIGADIFGIELFGVNFRLVQIFLFFLAILLIVKGTYRLTMNVWLVGFIIFSFISTLTAFELVRAVMFYFSIIYNVLLVFYAISAYIKTYGLKQFIRILRVSCYVQFGVLILQFFLKVAFNYEFSFMPSYGEFKGIPRFQLWFYEPSYFVSYLLFWFTISFMMVLLEREKSYFVDVLLALIMFIMSTSTSGFVGLALVICIVYLIWLCRGITLTKLIFPIAAIVALIVFRFVFYDMFNVFIARLFRSSLNDASGGRLQMWKETLNVFAQNPFFGVGAGNYGLYLGKGTSHVPSNVTLDLMATLGIFGTITFYGFSINLLVKCFRMHARFYNKETFLLYACAWALIIFTIILQVNQGYLRLYHWMFFGVLDGGKRYLYAKCTLN